MTIITTPLDNLRPVHQGSSEIGNRYQQLKNLLKDGAYTLFAEPEYLSTGEIEWKTELRGDVVQYTQADEKTQENMLIQLKQQVTTILNRKNIKDNEEIQEYLSLILEIPDLDNIYAVNNHIVLCNWGYIEDKHNAERDIIKKLIEGVLFTVNIEDEDGVIISKLPIQVKYGQDSSEYITNDDGQILLDVIYGSSVDIHIDLQNNDRYKDNSVSKNILCLKDKTEETVVLKLAEVVVPLTPPTISLSPSWFSRNKKKVLIALAALLLLFAGLFSLSTQPIDRPIDPPKKKKELTQDITITVYDKETNQVIGAVDVTLNYIKDSNNTALQARTNSNGQITKTLPIGLRTVGVKANNNTYKAYQKDNVVIDGNIKIYLEKKLTTREIIITVYDKKTNQVMSGVDVTLSYEKDASPQTQQGKTNSSGQMVKTIPIGLGTIAVKTFKYAYDEYFDNSILINDDSIEIYLEKPKKSMIIPDKKTKDFSFAEGLWKSTTRLNLEKDPNNEVTLYFEIKKSGKGTIVAKLSKNNEECKAKIFLTLSGKKLKINQPNRMQCNKNTGAINPYRFNCTATANGVAECSVTGNNNISFGLERQ